MPSPIRSWLMSPTSLLSSSPIQAYTRSRKEVQKGSITIISSTLRTDSCARAMW